MNISRFLQKKEAKVDLSYPQFEAFVQVVKDISDAMASIESNSHNELLILTTQLQIAVFNDMATRLKRKWIDTKPSAPNISIKFNDDEALACLLVFRQRPYINLIESQYTQTVIDEVYGKLHQHYA